jgi:ribosome-binding ATPase YchF (GTP1/OBG family)
MAVIADPRLDRLRAIYNPKKVTPAAMEICDTPGLNRGHEGNAARLAMIRESHCLVLVAAAFDRHDDPLADIRAFEEDLLLADMEVITGRLKRIEEAMKKPIPRQEREQLHHEQTTLRRVLAAMESGRPLRESEMSEEERLVTRAFRLCGEKPRLVVFNTADDEQQPERFTAAMPPDVPALAIPVGLELELARMTPQDRAAFAQELGVGGADRNVVIQALLAASGQHTFFTANEREVRAWLLRRGGTALEAAECIHSDMARGFIRAEIMTVSDLVRLGGEREVKAHHLFHQQPKDYVIGDDDIVFIRFSV